MAVKVVRDGNTLKFYPESTADNDTAEFLSKLVNDAKALVKSADPATVAKSGLTGTAFIRRAQEEKIRVLKSIVDREDERSRDWSTSTEIRSIAKARADAARDEIRKLAQELGE
jgi:hypothetical protein